MTYVLKTIIKVINGSILSYKRMGCWLQAQVTHNVAFIGSDVIDSRGFK